MRFEWSPVLTKSTNPPSLGNNRRRSTGVSVICKSQPGHWIMLLRCGAHQGWRTRPETAGGFFPLWNRGQTGLGRKRDQKNTPILCLAVSYKRHDKN